MPIQFSPIQPPSPPVNCPICLDVLHEDVVAHGQLHPIHAKCLKVWTDTHPICPLCRGEIIPPPLSWGERIVQPIHNWSNTRTTEEMWEDIFEVLANCGLALYGAGVGVIVKAARSDESVRIIDLQIGTAILVGVVVSKAAPFQLVSGRAARVLVSGMTAFAVTAVAAAYDG